MDATSFFVFTVAGKHDDNFVYIIESPSIEIARQKIAELRPGRKVISEIRLEREGTNRLVFCTIVPVRHQLSNEVSSVRKELT